MRCTTCDAEFDANTLGGLCPVCLLDAAWPEEADEGAGTFRYDLIEEIARGGMGVVYRAVQHGSQRQVAVKMILAEQSATPGMMERFRAEAEAVASLDDPHILPIYEIGETEGRPFYSMKFANGGTLRDCAADFSAPRDAARLIATIARAVHHAHNRGILHRDLKPGNILLDGPERKPYVSDFGLARWIGRESRLTLAQSALGTPHYIAPEQAEGSSSKLTPAADVYSLGAILYELLTDGPPFVADTPLETLRLSRETEPPSLRSLKPSVPRDLEVICLKCLAKDPSARYSSAAALAQDLERWLGGQTILARPATAVERAWSWTRRNRALAGVSAALAVALLSIGIALRLPPFSARAPLVSDAPTKSIAVLPFENLSPDPDSAYFAHGVQEEILTRLAKIGELKVISRASTQGFTSKPSNLREIANRLGVANILQGSVQKSGDAVRVNVQLINATTDVHLWGEVYDRKLTDIFRVESDIAKAVAETLQAKLTGAEVRAIAVRPTENTVAHQLYLKGRYFWNKTTTDDLRKSIDYFTQALAADPNYALAHVGIADANLLLPFFSGGRPDEYYPKAKAAAQRALEIDETLAEAHIAFAEVLRVYDFDYARASAEFERGLQLNPNYAMGHWRRSWLLGALGRFDEAFDEMKRAVELDPLSLIINTDLAYLYTVSGHLDQAIEQVHRTLEIDPNFYYARANLGFAYVCKGFFDEAIAEYRKVQALTDDPFAFALLAHAYGAAGNKAEVGKMLNELQQIAKHRYVPATALACAHLALGENDEALRWLEKSYADHAGADLAFIRIDPLFASLRGDPRFEALADTIVPAPTPAGTVPAAKSIAVLPFDNLSGDPGNAFFTRGVQDEILARLAKIGELKVISRRSTEKYHSAPANLHEIAKQLGVANVLQGSVQNIGDRVRIAVQLINAKSNAQLWAETYDRKLSDIFEVQTDVAQQIATSLEAKLSGRERREIARVPTTNQEAYDAYLRARAFDGAQIPEEIDRGTELLRSAVQKDPNFALAWAHLAQKESEKYFGYIHTPEQLRRARQAAETAMRLQPDLAEAHLGMGLFHYYCLQDYERAMAELNEARIRSPGTADVLLSMAMVTRRQGKLDESIELQREAANLDPRNLDIWLNLGRSYRGARRFADAHAMFDRALTIAPGDLVPTLHKAENLIAQGDLEGAEKLTANLEQHPLADPYGRSVSALTFHRRWDKAIAIVAADVQQKEVASPPLAALGRAIIAGFKHAAGMPDAAALVAASEKELLSLSAQGSASIRMRSVLLELEAALGKRGEIERQAETLLRDMAKDRWQLSLCEEAVARAYAILGDADRALPLVERALSATGFAALTPAYLRFDPVWDRIRNDPRFNALASKGVTP